MKYPGAVTLAALAMVLALAGSLLVRLLRLPENRPLYLLEVESLIAMPLLTAVVLALVLAVQKLGPRPFLTLLWLSVGALAAYMVFTVTEMGLFYLPAVALAVLAVVRTRPAQRRPTVPKSR